MPETTDGVSVRPYDPDDDGDRRALWTLKTAFETGLGSGTGDDVKEAKYEDKLTDEYRQRWLAWVDRCVTDDPCVVLAEPDTDDAKPGVEPEKAVVGYVFVLPERLAFIWDAAVVNELYVAPEWRGTGVADELMEAAVAVASEQNLPLERLLLDVDSDNARAYAFYERHGFEPWGEIVARDL